jgi:hypothetical protein
MMERLPESARAVADDMGQRKLAHRTVTSLVDSLPAWISKQKEQLSKTKSKV